MFDDDKAANDLYKNMYDNFKGIIVPKENAEEAAIVGAAASLALERATVAVEELLHRLRKRLGEVLESRRRHLEHDDGARRLVPLSRKLAVENEL